MKKILIPGLLLVAGSLSAGTRLTYTLNGKPTPIYWSPSAFPISFHVSSTVPAKMPQLDLIIDGAFASWQAVGEAAVNFKDSGMVNAVAGRDGKNVISITDQLFRDSGFIAYTTNWFEDDGRMIESDIQVDEVAARDGYDLNLLVQHEIGHLLGLDHSAVLSSVMFPYISYQDLGGLDTDDRITIATLYPRAAIKEWGSILRGTVRDGSGGVFGAQVVAMSTTGAPLSTDLTDENGQFELVAVPDGEYTLYVEPLDGPVESANLSGFWRSGRTGFRTAYHSAGQTVKIRRGEIIEGLNLQLDARPASLNAKWIGVFPEQSADIRLAVTASKLRPGDRVCIAVGGEGFTSGMTTFEALNSGITRVSDFKYGPNYVWATFTVAANTPEQSVVIQVTSGDEVVALTGAVRIERQGRRRSVRG